MRSLWTNRILFVLALGALFIATMLLISHIYVIQLPCANTRGCNAVERSHWSTILGLPTALYGLIFDFVVAAICFVRPGRPERCWRRGSLLLSLFGLAAMAGSGILIFISVTEINALCEWCLAHAIVVTLIAFTASAEYSKYLPDDTEFPPARERWRLLIPLVIALVATASYGVYLNKTSALLVYHETTYTPSLMGKHPWSRGDASAPITIIEFGDFECPSCADAGVRITKMLKEHPGKIRHIYRHYVLTEIHPRATELAELAEWAGTKGRFWPVYESVTGNPEPGKNGKYDGYARAAGLDRNEMAKFLGTAREDKKGAHYAAFLRVYEDYQDAHASNINSTPTFFVIVRAPGAPARTLRADNVGGLLSIMDLPVVERLLRR
jgi:uncharacterized membrane protein